MKLNNKKIIFFSFLMILLFAFSACKEKECEKDIDCFKKGFTGKCVDNKCQYTIIQNFCGNGLCESGENKCSCPEDCGLCSGAVQGSKNLVQKCVNGACLQDTAASKPVSYNKDVNYGGDSFNVNVVFNQPFNVKKDKVDLNIILSSKNERNKDEFIKDVEISAKTSDNRNIVIARKEINKHLWASGSEIEEEIILDFPFSKVEEELKTIVLKINYEYTLISLGKETEKSGTLNVPLNAVLLYVYPTIDYPCPLSCDDNDPATRDYCDSATHFCMHEYIEGVCGNYKCESGENKCTCPKDCGPCEGDVGKYLSLKCENDECIAKLKTTEVEVKSILDERNIGAIKLINNYIYDQPFNINEDKFHLEFKIYSLPEDISEIKIDAVRVLEGTDELGKVEPKQKISEQGNNVDVLLNPISSYEDEKSIILKIWYSYLRNGETIKGSYTKSLGNIVFINPK